MTDLWALGITFFRLATGRFPYQDANTYLKLKASILSEEEIDFSLIKDAEMRQILSQML